MNSQVEIVGGEYVGKEFHFRLKMPLLKIPKIPDTHIIKMQEMGIKVREIPELPDSIESVIKMQKVDGAWRIYADQIK